MLLDDVGRRRVKDSAKPGKIGYFAALSEREREAHRVKSFKVALVEHGPAAE